MLLLTAFACHRPAPDPVVLMISLDTTRADALSAYADVAGWGLELPATDRPAPRTPHLDALAQRGARFQWALSQTPTTLSSHSSVFSGQDPHQHRVPRNGFPIPADVPLLTERFAAAGWDTLGVVGASVLSAEMGLNRGFSHYDDAVSLQVRRRYEDHADRVTDRALAAVTDHHSAGRPLFLFVHYFDAHSPWDSAPAALRAEALPQGYQGAIDGSSGSLDTLITLSRAGRLGQADRRAARALYLSEVAWVDQEVGRLLQGLDDRGLLDQALIVTFGDHGETLDELPGRAYGHGLDVELFDLHVPLIFAGPGVPVGLTDGRLVRLQDIGSTLLPLAGLAGGLGEGRDLSRAWAPGAAEEVDPPAFAEATKPVDPAPAAWNNLRTARAVAAEGLLYRRTPWAEAPPTLRQRSPAAPLAADPAAEARLDALLTAWDAAAPPPRLEDLSEETEAGLQALGYLER